MSRIGNYPVNIPSGVEVKIKDSFITVKGPKGELTQQIDSCITIQEEDGTLVFKRDSDKPDHRAKHGLYRSLVSNMIVGVTEGYKKVLEFIGVGFRADVKGQLLTLSVGFSHPIVFELPEEVKGSTVSEKGKAPVLTLESIDKQLIGQVASKIRSYRKPEPYKGKGIRYQGEYIRRKAGKSAAAS